eukprot:CAMPEP_0119167160 /NCGR_PEP_ID=MMETSP1315-20130426/6367_1 /TAXON_ID=676789 /ORGANISM="Prasinoderma singularis, Strain RCC927" /LENGTH=143 /DNA_ID=CAMNT_0007160597 /DNA_START=249 /DNA_END=677 /DNA_ORIENTATION=+
MTSQSTAQQRRNGVVSGLLCMPQRRSTLVVHQSLVRARLEQQLDSTRVVEVGRAHERRHALILGQINAAASRQQNLDDRLVAIYSSIVKGSCSRAVAVRALCVLIGACLEQQLDGTRVIVVSRGHERRPAVIRGQVNAAAGRQ